MPETYFQQAAAYGQPAGIYIPEYPFEFAMQAGAAKQKKIEDVYSQLDLLGKPFNYIRTPNTEKKAQEIKSDIDFKLNELASIDPTTPEFTPKFQSLKREVIARRSPGGDINALETDYSNYIEKQKNTSEQISKEKIFGSTAQELNKIDLEEYDTSIDRYISQGKGTPIYNKNPYANYQDTFGDAVKLMNEIKATVQFMTQSEWKALGFAPENYEKRVAHITSLSENEILARIMPSLKNNPQYTDFINQEKKILGKKLLESGYTPTESTEKGSFYAQQMRPGLDVYSSEGQQFLKAGQFMADVEDEVNDKYFGKAATSAALLGRQYEEKVGFERIKSEEESERARKKIEKEGLFTIANESVLTPGEPLDYKSLSDKKSTLETGLNQLPAPGSANDNYQVQTQREDLTKRLAIINNTLNTGITRYYSSKDGIEEVNKLYSEAKFSNNVKLYIKNKEDLRKFMMGQLKLPENVMKEGFVGPVGTAAWTGIIRNMENLQKIGLSDKINEYNKENPISYAANVLTGEEKSTVNEYNKVLTQRVTTQGTNYTTPDGVQLNVFMSKNLAEGDKVQVSAMDDAIGGQYAHYLTIRDKAGNKKIEMPIYPKSGAKEELGYVGRQLMKDNQLRKDPLQQDQYKRGEKMLANSYFSDGINDEYINSFANLTENNGPSQVIKNVSINLPSGSIPITVEIFKRNNITYYAPKYEDGTYIKATSGKVEKEDKAYKSLDDMKIDLLRGFKLDITE